jgi:hypothetical protein
VKEAGTEFDEAYWRNVERYGKTCDICGHTIKPSDHPNGIGWTHDDPDWQGVRCVGSVMVARPAGRDMRR